MTASWSQGDDTYVLAVPLKKASRINTCTNLRLTIDALLFLTWSKLSLLYRLTLNATRRFLQNRKSQSSIINRHGFVPSRRSVMYG